MLEVQGLEVAYGDAQVLFGVNLKVSEGEIVALVGSNGAGKTSLLSAVSGLLRPSGGSIRLFGKEVAGLRPHEVLGLGAVLVPEGRQLFPGMTVEENLLMGAYGRKGSLKHDLERVYAYFPRLGERRKQIAGKLSGGEQQMAAIGRGLMARPKLMMVDELSLGLAPVITEKLFEILKQINREGVTVLLVEQDVQWALEIAHQGYVLEHGRIGLSGPASELLGDARVKSVYLGM